MIMSSSRDILISSSNPSINQSSIKLEAYFQSGQKGHMFIVGNVSCKPRRFNA
ncbi:hypothetical protein AALP_AA3G201400 [Arabis alpina]|uniref:Uncharacterized protein n=1 Tax=Arabis alpina TaxID=50452 RepID=A0A087HAF2_ARAAL|nr:hypothetical protein AALP_AA3G201400 [Arabis alpina]